MEIIQASLSDVPLMCLVDILARALLLPDSGEAGADSLDLRQLTWMRLEHSSNRAIGKSPWFPPPHLLPTAIHFLLASAMLRQG